LSDQLSWVVGRGGLLGHNVERALASTGRVWHPPESFDWSDPRKLMPQISAACADFARQAGTSRWQLAWCAGAGVIGSSSRDLQRETEIFRHLLDAVAATIGAGGVGSGVLFLTSSAGGVYAGSKGSPYSERSSEQPLTPYGWNKLEQEGIARLWSADHKVPVLIGRIANLYGPGQNLGKEQGLITQVCRRLLAREPFTLYVPLDTIRDYLYAPDCGALVADGLVRLRQEASEGVGVPVVMKIFASQQPNSVSTVLAEIRRVIKRPARVILAGSPRARHQASDLRMTSVVWPELDRRPLTALGVGVHQVVLDLLATMERGQLTPAPAR
jgi:UDP-glucose 4-epimerase